MAEPTFVTIEHICFARGHFDREQALRALGIVGGFKPFGLWSAVIDLWSTGDKGASQQGFICVDRSSSPKPRQLSNRPGDTRVEVHDVAALTRLVVKVRGAM